MIVFSDTYARVRGAQVDTTQSFSGEKEREGRDAKTGVGRGPRT